MKRGSVLCGAALGALAGPLLAQSTDPVVVTATRTAATADASLAAVTVITREDIERRQSQDLVDLLRVQAGIDVSRTGGPGGTVDLFLRGTDSNHVLVLVDGVRVASQSTGIFEWRSFPVALIERIEIVRGPRASLYGSDAIGGVIQIFTRRPKGPELGAGLGSDRTRRVEAAWGGGERVRVHAAAVHDETDGFSAQNEQGFDFDPDDDGFSRSAVTAAGQLPFGDRGQLELSGWRSSGEAEFDVGESDLANEMLNARLHHATSDRWSQALQLGYASDDLVTHDANASRFTTRRRMAEWQHDLTLGARTQLTAGLSYVSESGENLDRLTGATVFDRTQRNRGLFALLQTRQGETDVQISTRYDDYSTFGSQATGSVALGRALGPDLRGFISYGSGFRAPTLNELYHPGFGGLFAGSPSLEPEHSRTAEASVQARPAENASVRLSFYRTWFEDLIDFQGVNFQAINVAEASVRGAELEHDLSVGPWHAHTALTLQQTRNEETGAELLRRPRAKLSTFVERRLGHGAAGAEWILVSRREDFGGELPGYGLVNLAARYALARALTLEARLENLFDKTYELARGFNTPDRSVFLGLRYRP